MLAHKVVIEGVDIRGGSHSRNPPPLLLRIMFDGLNLFSTCDDSNRLKWGFQVPQAILTDGELSRVTDWGRGMIGDGILPCRCCVK